MKITLVGHGHLGKWHAQKLNLIHRDNFHSIVEADTSKHSEISALYPNLRIVSSIEEILNDIDAVVIATPTTFHFELIKKTLLAGKHCFVEKPMTNNSIESKEIGKILNDNSNLIFQVGHSERFHGFWSDVKSRENFSQATLAKFDRLAPYKGRGDDVDIIYDLMIHDYDLINFLDFGNLLSIRAWGKSCHTKMIDYCQAILQYPQSTVFVSASRSNVQEKRSAEIVFNDGVLEIDFMSEELRRSKKGMEDSRQIYPKEDHLLREHELFKSSIETGKNNHVNFSVGNMAMRMLDLTLLSIKENREISWS